MLFSVHHTRSSTRPHTTTPHTTTPHTTTSHTTHQTGYSLVELLVTLGIITLLTTLALPAMAALVRNTQTASLANSLIAASMLARTTAIAQRTSVVLCGKGDNACGKDWQNGAMVFTDANNNRKLEPNEGDTLVTELDHPPAGSQLSMKAALNKQYLRFMPNGMLENTAGSLQLCPAGNDAHQARILIFNRSGRFRFGTDANHDGIQEDANRQPLRCPL